MIDFDEALSIARLSGARLIAIDGLPLSGKSTLAERFETEMQATCVYLDDFVWPEAEWRGRIEPAFPFGYIRYDEFLSAVRTLARGETARYQLYDWATGHLSDKKIVGPERPVIVEGVSALHPDLAPLYDLRFWIESDAATTLSASLDRGVGEWETEWRDLFMPSVELYLRTNPQNRADHLVAGRGARR